MAKSKSGKGSIKALMAATGKTRKQITEEAKQFRREAKKEARKAAKAGGVLPAPVPIWPGKPMTKKLERKLQRKQARRVARELRAIERKKNPPVIKKKGKLKDRRRAKEERRLAREAEEKAKKLALATGSLISAAPAAGPAAEAAEPAEAAAAAAAALPAKKKRKLQASEAAAAAADAEPAAASSLEPQPQAEANGHAEPAEPAAGKKKKRRREAQPEPADPETPAAAEANGHAEPAEPAAGKKQRRKAIQLRPAEPPAADPPPAEANGPAEAAEPAEPAAGKKQKRRKEAQPEAAEQLAEPAAGGDLLEPDAPAVSPKKKQRKQKAAAEPAAASPAAASTQPSSARAVVGDHALADSLPPLVKHLYQEAPSIAAMSAADVASWREQRSTAVKGCDLKPVTSFAEAGFPKALRAVTKGFTAPSPIQAQCWPIVLSGHDLIGNAATGSGKTLAFILPALAHIMAQTPAEGKESKQPQALVLTPTRELAQQILGVATEAGSLVDLRCVLAVGGLSKRDQAAEMKQGAAVVVATPGRLQDLVDSKMCRLQRISFLVLDEADRMLDLGFEPAIRAIAQVTRADRQTLMFSATWPAGIGKLAAEFLSNPTRVNIGSTELAASHSIAQAVEVVEAHEKDGKLLGLLAKHHKSRANRILVFVLYKKEAARVEALLQRKGWKAAAVHGDLSQDKRTQAVQGFKDGSVPLLVATDVAARGLDIPDVELVINYSFPLTVEDYVHRVGRSGRAGQAGMSHTLFCVASDKGLAGGLVNVLKEAAQPVPPELAKLGGTVKKRESKLYGAHFKDVDPTAKATKITFED